MMMMMMMMIARLTWQAVHSDNSTDQVVDDDSGYFLVLFNG